MPLIRHHFGPAFRDFRLVRTDLLKNWGGEGKEIHTDESNPYKPTLRSNKPKGHSSHGVVKALKAPSLRPIVESWLAAGTPGVEQAAALPFSDVTGFADLKALKAGVASTMKSPPRDSTLSTLTWRSTPVRMPYIQGWLVQCIGPKTSSAVCSISKTEATLLATKLLLDPPAKPQRLTCTGSVAKPEWIRF